MKTIWIIDHYSSEPKYGGISRQYDFAKELGKRGYRVVVISSSFCHFTHSYFSEKRVFITRPGKNIFYVYLRTGSYQNNNGAGRAWSMVDFMGKVLKYEKAIAERCQKPDVVIGCSVHPLAWIAAYRVASKYKVRFCAEVRDFWPRIWVAGGDKKRMDPMVLFFDAIQRWAFWKADKIIYSMSRGKDYLCGELGVPKSKAVLIGQPMDCDRFDENAKKEEMLPNPVREFLSDGFICSFAGYYMVYEGVYVMLEALKILEEKGLPVKMLFVGSGQEREGMMEYARRNGLKNVLIYDRIPKEAVPALLQRSQVCMAHLEVKGHKEVYQYGVSKNKVNEYLYSGACTLYGFLYQEDEVASSGGGMMFKPYNAEDLAEKIEMVYEMTEDERRQFGMNGRRYIRENRRVEALTDKLVRVLFG